MTYRFIRANKLTMKKALELINSVVIESSKNGSNIEITFSNPMNKEQEVKKIIVTKTSNQKFKIDYRYLKHFDIKNVDTQELTDQLGTIIANYKQIMLKTESNGYQILLNKKGKSKIIEQQVKAKTSSKHNKDKNYLIPDNKPCDFLIEVGIMTPQGKVKSSHYKKFKQINRYLEIVDDMFKNEQKNFYHIVDFGCGKSYLTFALYFYFKQIKNIDIKITGIDLKKEVIELCNNIATKLNYKELSFVHGMIHDFKTDLPIDFVVTLHACDTATDDAILFSIDNQAQKMIFVPCCQHELNKQLQNEKQNPLLRHGIYRERLTGLVTDTMRAQLLESVGYKVQSLEFIDLEHTAKNIALRCTKTQRREDINKKSFDKYISFKKEWQIKPYLEQELIKRNLI